MTPQEAQIVTPCGFLSVGLHRGECLQDKTSQ